MKVVVCIKQVPNRDFALAPTADGSWIREENLAWEINEFDLYGIEAALTLKDQVGAEVVVVSVGPERTSDALRKALAMGADRAVLITDEQIPRHEPYAVARVLATAIARESVDLVITGVQSEDMAFFQTGPVVAELLGLETAVMVVGVELETAGVLKVRQELEGGRNEAIRLKLPAALLVQTGWNQPRYASLKGIMMAKKKPLEKVTLADLGLAEEVLAAGTFKWLGIEEPVQESEVELLEGTPAEVAAALLERLKKEARVL